MTSPLREAVRQAARALADAGIDSAEADAMVLAACALKTTTSEVRKLMILGAPAPDGLEDLVRERARRVPLQHLTGKSGFRRLELSVGPGVFVPRFETELVAGLAITHLLRRVGEVGPELQVLALGLPLVVVDLCTGSGAIALAIKDEFPAAQVHAVELSDLAHAWAIRNRDDLGLDVDIRLGDATQAFPDLAGCVDLVVSNPPYIPVGSVPNDPEVRDHDPEIALYGGSSDGLAIPLQVAARAAVLLRPEGFLVMEHADVQGVSLPNALRATGCWQEIRDHRDLNERPRAVTAVRAG
ncbi:MAG: peptide chain release factor N(5)-glutamine methyltransferase [Dermatophilaceae bacterium]